MTFHPARLALILITAAALPAFAADKNVAVVNGKPIPQSAVESIVKLQTARGQPDTPQLRADVTQQLINIELLSQEGLKLGLDKSPDVKRELELVRKEVIGRATVSDFVKKNPPKEADIKAEYEKYKEHQSGLKEYLAHQIVVDKEDDAKDIIAKLKGGAKFEDLAKLSKDVADAANGGKLDWAPASRYPKPFSDALEGLKKEQFTDTPVKTQYGFHVIKLDDVREAKVETYEALKPNISQWLAKQQLQAYQQKLEKKAKIEISK